MELATNIIKLILVKFATGGRFLFKRYCQT